MNLLLLLVLGMIWGSSYLFIRVIVAEVPVLTFVAARLALSAAILWILLRPLGHSVPRGRAQWGAFAVLGILNGIVPYVLIAWGERTISSGLAALLQATMPIFAVILAHFLGEERMTAKSAVGIALGFVGVTILLLPDLRRGLQANLLGQLAVILSSLSYAGAAIFARRQPRGQPPLVWTMGQLTMATVFTLPLALAADRPLDLSPSVPVLAAWLALVVLGTVVAYTIYYALIERTSATFVSTVTYIIPVNGLILGALVLGETLHGTLVASLALILLGVLLVKR